MQPTQRPFRFRFLVALGLTLGVSAANVSAQQCQFVLYCNGDQACPVGNPNDGSAGIAGCANSAGPGGATLRVSNHPCGSQTQLLGAGLPPGQPGVYLQALNQINGGLGLAFGNGLRCAGGNVLRLQVRTANTFGQSNTTVDIFAGGGIVPGTLRRYQLWYRDPAAGAAGFNLTNGLELF